MHEATPFGCIPIRRIRSGPIRRSSQEPDPRRPRAQGETAAGSLTSDRFPIVSRDWMVEHLFGP